MVPGTVSLHESLARSVCQRQRLEQRQRLGKRLRSYLVTFASLEAVMNRRGLHVSQLRQLCFEDGLSI